MKRSTVTVRGLGEMNNKNLSFSKALDLLKEGKKVRRNEWLENEYLYLEEVENGGRLVFQKMGNINKLFSAFQEDLLADDWRMIVDES